MELVRTTGSNRLLLPIALQACKRLNVTSLVLLYSDTAYGKSAAEVFNGIADQYNVCVQETIILKENRTMIQSVGKRLATEKFTPARVFLLFAEEHITKTLINSIAAKDVLWSETGRILITESDLTTVVDCDLVHKFLWSLRVHSMLPNLKSFRNEFHRFDAQEAFNNFWYAQYWQQQGQCFLSNMSNMPTSFSLPFPKKCDYVTGSTIHHVTNGSVCSWKDVQTQNSLNDPVVETTYASWTLLAITILNTPQKSLPSLLRNKTLLIKELLQTNMSLFDSLTHQGSRGSYSTHISNLNKFSHQVNPSYIYTDIFKVSQNGHSASSAKLIKQRDPIFYRHGEVDGYLRSKCPPLDCQCVPRKSKHFDSLPGKMMQMQNETKRHDVIVTKGAGYDIMAVFLGIFVSVTVVLTLCTLRERFRHYLPQYKKYKSEYIINLNLSKLPKNLFVIVSCPGSHLA